jgi:hypothetical protein
MCGTPWQSGFPGVHPMVTHHGLAARGRPLDSKDAVGGMVQPACHGLGNQVPCQSAGGAQRGSGATTWGARPYHEAAADSLFIPGTSGNTPSPRPPLPGYPLQQFAPLVPHRAADLEVRRPLPEWLPPPRRGLERGDHSLVVGALVGSSCSVSRSPTNRAGLRPRPSCWKGNLAHSTRRPKPGSEVEHKDFVRGRRYSQQLESTDTLRRLSLWEAERDGVLRLLSISLHSNGTN